MVTSTDDCRHSHVRAITAVYKTGTARYSRHHDGQHEVAFVLPAAASGHAVRLASRW